MNYVLVDRGFAELNPLLLGAEQCAPAHRYGPSVRPYYLLHYVLSGKGRFWAADGREYTVSKGGYFLIRPGEITTYEADGEDPWQYFWVHFESAWSARLAALPPVGLLSAEPFLALYGAAQSDFRGWEGAREEYAAALLHRILAELLVDRPSHAHYARRAETYIRAMYMQDVSVEGIAEMLSLDRRYLSRLFKGRYGVSMQQYLISVRLENAARLLRSGHTVAEAAVLVGYKDAGNFSKSFHRRYGVSPRGYAAESERKA